MAQKKGGNRPTSSKGKPAATHDALIANSFEGLTGAGKVAWWALLIMIFLVPLAMSNFMALGFKMPITYDVYDTFKIMFLRVGSVVMLAAWIIDIVMHGGKIRTNPVFWVFGAFLIWAGISTVLSIHPDTSFFGKYRRYDGYWSYLIYAALFFLTIQYTTNTSRVKAIAKALTFSSALVAFYGILQAAGLEPIMLNTQGFESGRSFSTYGNPDLLAGFLAFSTFIAFGLALSERRKGWRVAWWIIFLMNAVVILTAYSRSIWVGAIFGFAAIIVFAIRQRQKLHGSDWAFVGLTGAAGVGLFIKSLSSANYVTNIASRFASIFDFKTGSALTRFEIWDAAWRAIKAKPIFGWGPDTFRLVFRKYAPTAYAKDAGYRSVADNVHNYVLQSAAGIGIIGMLLFYTVPIWTAIASFSTAWKRGETEAARSNKMLYAGFWAACLAYMVHLFFGLSLPAATFMLFISMGVLMAPHCKTHEVKAVGIVPVMYGVSALAIVGAGVVSIISVRYVMADYNYMWASAYGNAGSYSQAKPYAEKAIALNPHNDMYRMELVKAKAAAISEGTVTDDEISAAIAEGESALAYAPDEYDNYLVIGSFYVQMGYVTGNDNYYKEGAALMKKQMEKTPSGLALRYIYSQTLYGMGQKDAAIKELEIVTTQDPNFAEAAKMKANMEKGLPMEKLL